MVFFDFFDPLRGPIYCYDCDFQGGPYIAYYSTFGNSTKNTISRVNIMYFSKCKYLTFPKAKKKITCCQRRLVDL